MKFQPKQCVMLMVFTLLCLPAPLVAQEEGRTSSFSLSNGMTWIVTERPGSGGVFAVTYADAGASREIPGRTGISQLIRYLHLHELKTSGWTTARAWANMDWHCVTNTMSSADLERWLQSEAHRIARPEFPSFQDVRKTFLAERERRRSGPAWVVEDFQSVAFLTHPYRQPLFGYQGDVELLTREDVEEFYAGHFSPANTIISIAGEVNAKEVRRMAEKYFGQLSGGRKPEVLRPVEQPQRAERRILASPAPQGQLLIGFHKGAVADSSYALWDVLTPVLENRMRLDLVERERLATRVSVALGFPAMRYPGLFFVLVLPAPGVDMAALETRVLEHLERVKHEPVSTKEIAAVKSQLKDPGSNEIAIHLADWQAMTGDWHNCWRHAEQIEMVTAAQLQKLAQQTFITPNRTTAVVPVGK